MKPAIFMLLALTMAFSTPTFAQNGKVDTQDPNTLWLQNSEGQMVKTSKDTIPRSFFLAKEVTIYAQKPLKNEERFMVVIQPSDGSMSKAYSLRDAVLSVEVVRALEKAPIGTLVTCLRTLKNGSKLGTSAALQVVLGP